MWATDLVLTFSLTSNPGDWPTANSTTLTNYTYTLEDVDYTFALNNVKCNSGYLMLTSTAVLGLPAIENYRLKKVVASNSSGCSTRTEVGVSSSSSTPSYITGGAQQTWSTTNSSYTYNLSATAENTMYYLYVTTKNAQITQLELTYESTIVSVNGVTLSEDSKALAVGEDFDLTATVAPATATNKALAWTVINESTDGVVSLSSTTAATTTVTAEKEGTATVRVTTTDGSFTADCDITVSSASAPRATISTSSLAFGDIEVGQTKDLTFTVTPANLTGALTIVSDNDKYTVSPTSIAQDADGAQTITVTAAPTALNDEMDGTITISGGGITTQTVTLTAAPYAVSNVTLVASGSNGTFEYNDEVVTSITSRVGNAITVTAVPNDGYIFNGWIATGATPASSNTAMTEFTLTGTTVTLTADFAEDPKRYTTLDESAIVAMTGSTGYGNLKTTIKDGLTWNTTGYKSSSTDKYIQLRTNGTPYIQLPTFSGEIQTITFSVTSASGASKGADNCSAHLKFCATEGGEAVYTSSNSATKEIVIDLTGIVTKYNTGYIYPDAGVRVWDITVAYIPTDINVSVSSAKYATFCDHIARDFSASGITVYKAKAAGTKVDLTEISDGIVPANTGVVLYSATVKSDVAIPATTTNATLSDNELVGINTATTVAKTAAGSKTNYILSNEEAGVGFYLAAEGGATLAAHRAYLSTSTTAGAREFLGFDMDDTTGITDNKREPITNNGEYFNLAGQRVAQPTKGLYIVNGKKVVIK